MKTNILSIVLGILLIVGCPVSALEPEQVGGLGGVWNQLPAATIVAPGTGYSHIFSIPTEGVAQESCTDPAIYQAGSCNYLYKCYVILPQDCEESACARALDCIEIAALQNPETLAVFYATTPADAGISLGVVAFITEARMTYDFTTQVWSESITVIDASKVGDTIDVQTVPAPGRPDIMGWLSSLFSTIIGSIRAFLCNVLHLCI